MKIGRSTIFAAAMLVWASAAAQTDEPSTHHNTTVYKCTRSDGSVVFSETPCSPDPSKVQEVDTSRALLTGSGGTQDEISAGVAADDCHRLARRSAYATVDVDVETSNRHIADYQERQTQLAAQKVFASDGSGQLIDDPNSSQAIADIDASIAREREFQEKARTDAEAAYEKAANGCAGAGVKPRQDNQQ